MNVTTVQAISTPAASEAHARGLFTSSASATTAPVNAPVPGNGIPTKMAKDTAIPVSYCLNRF